MRGYSAPLVGDESGAISNTLPKTVHPWRPSIAVVIGVQSVLPFDRIEFRELVGTLDNEYWGTFLYARCPAPGAPSSEIERLGSPPNPAAFLPGQTSGPVVGATWDPVIDHTTFMPSATFDFMGITVNPLNLSLPPFGTLLCDPTVIVTIQTSSAGVPFAVPVPNDCFFVGVTVYTQGASLDALGNIVFTNALDITIGTF